jgi:hypothetical protein
MRRAETDTRKQTSWTGTPPISSSLTSVTRLTRYQQKSLGRSTEATGEQLPDTLHDSVEPPR